MQNGKPRRLFIYPTLAGLAIFSPGFDPRERIRKPSEKLRCGPLRASVEGILASRQRGATMPVEGSCISNFTRARDAFNAIYQDKVWGCGSGIGSLPEYAAPYMQFLQQFIRNNTVKSVVDVGCGDWQFSRLISWDGVTYQGFDVAESVIAENRRRFGKPGISFDVVSRLDDLPPSDLVVCKDVLQHLPINDVLAYLKYFRKNYRFGLITNDIFPSGNTNKETEYGGCRAIRLDLLPFNQAAPVLLRYEIRQGTSLWIKDTCLMIGNRRKGYQSGSRLQAALSRRVGPLIQRTFLVKKAAAVLLQKGPTAFLELVRIKLSKSRQKTVK